LRNILGSSTFETCQELARLRRTSGAHASEQGVSVRTCPDLADPLLQMRLQQYFDDRGGFPPRDSEDEYAVYFNLALCYVGIGNYDQAIRTLKELSVSGHANASVHNLLAQAYIGNRELDLACVCGEADGEELEVSRIALGDRVDTGGRGVKDQNGAAGELCQFQLEAHAFTDAGAIDDGQRRREADDPAAVFGAYTLDVGRGGAQGLLDGDARFIPGPAYK